MAAILTMRPQRVVPKLVILKVALAAFLVSTDSRSVGPQVPCFFVFGDSLVDNGNNNEMLTLARANYKPYGVDFPGGASGRFTNGRTTVDFLAQLLGFKHFIPPYVTAQDRDVLGGFNYASGAAGIRAETGNNLGEHYCFAEQVDHFRETVRIMTRKFRGNTTRVNDHLSKCIYYVGMGSNDYLNNYFMPNIYMTSYDYSPRNYADLLVRDYSKQLTQLYNLGARRVVVVGVGQIGCIPYELAQLDSSRGGGVRRRCNDVFNSAISMYNMALVTMVRRLNSRFPLAKFVYVNTYESSKDLVANAASYGFSVIDRGCCGGGVGTNNGEVTCLPLQKPCDDRSKHLFWDAFHPTEAANAIYAKKAYYSNSSSYVYPMNVKKLAKAGMTREHKN